MPDMSNEYLDELVKIFQPYATDGKGDISIPEINEKVEGYLGVAVTTIDGEEYKAGSHDFSFSMQSISKAVNFLVALEDLGFESVSKMVGVDTSDNVYNSITAFQEQCTVRSVISWSIRASFQAERSKTPSTYI